MVKTGWTFLGTLLMGTILACSPASNGPVDAETVPTAASPADGVTVAKIGDRIITDADLKEWIHNDLFNQKAQQMNASQRVQFARESLGRMVAEQLIKQHALSQGVGLEELLRQRIVTPPPINDERVEAFFRASPTTMGGKTLDEIAPKIREHLMAQATAAANKTAYESLVGELRKAAGVVILLEPLRLEVAAVGPAIGPAEAPVTIVEFSDFECPFCKRALPVVKMIRKAYPEQVRIVFRHFPLDSHERAIPAAEASACAGEQNRFWEFHDLLFGPKGGLEREDFDRYAEELALDAAQFSSCIDERRFQEQVQKDIEAGQKVGVTGTPAFFVNGIMVYGAQPFEVFAKLINEEIARQE